MPYSTYAAPLVALLAVGFSAAGPLNPVGAAASEITRRAPSELQCTPVTPSPAKSVCGTRGTYMQGSPSYYDFTNHQIVSSLAACTALTAPPMYESFGYNTTSGLCTLYVPQINAHGGVLLPVQLSDTVFYDADCFKCSISCPLTSGENLFTNPGFESSSTYIGPWTAYDDTPNNLGSFNQHEFPASISVVSPGSNSKNALNVKSGAFLNVVGQSFPYCANQLYVLEFDYKIGPKPKPTNTSTFQVQYPYNNGTSVSNIDPNPTKGKWITFQDLFTITPGRNDADPKRSNIALSTASNDPDLKGSTPNLFLDNFFVSDVSPLPAVQPAAGAQNLVPNGGFESGALAPWKFVDVTPGKKARANDSHAIVSPGLDGSNYAFRFTSKNQYGGSFVLGQTLTLTKGTWYVFSVHIAGPSDEPVVTIGTRHFSFGLQLSDRVNQIYSAYFVAQDETVPLVLAIPADVAGNVTIDNAIVQELAIQHA